MTRNWLTAWILVGVLPVLAGCGLGESGVAGDPSAGTNSELRPTQVTIQNDAAGSQRINFVSITRLVSGVPQAQPEYTYDGPDVLPGQQVPTKAGLGIAVYRFVIGWTVGGSDTIFLYDFRFRESWVLAVWPGGWHMARN